MRHRKKEKHLGRTSSHRKALRLNLTINLLTYGRIVTTMEKAKYVRPFVEKIITLAKKGIAKKEVDKPVYVHYYRQVLSKLNNKEIVRKLFGEGKWRESGCIAERYADRNGGYTRILRLSGSRMGVLSGSSVGDIPELEYKMEGFERKLRLIGNRLGDNASRVIFELVEEVEEEKEVRPKVSATEGKK
ncbi:MAG: 50S ribosomal protein L17 [Candidatus Scalindua rubra]|uniref:50S ribosomal protein L17 n=1 Tax=Candidatus Scalindua rubra TaxID=1872076 RepID=A0A1E3XDY3_9BACT|nr:MAG: 50S ribosomal protein L17 [Candidatus Scalindua rubra]